MKYTVWPRGLGPFYKVNNYKMGQDLSICYRHQIKTSIYTALDWTMDNIHHTVCPRSSDTILYSNLLYNKKGHYFLDRQYNYKTKMSILINGEDKTLDNDEIRSRIERIRF